ncbi:DUF3024 domain-containing protein [Providencia manganoxydans]|uniref:DUF3024 domain-containing protein n=1 Tax=Providencia manganoxydans TaxID=2923283 RepID=UPI0034E3AE32
MAFNDIEIANIKRCMEFFMEKRRPAPFIRDEIDLMYEIQDQSVIIKEVRSVMWRTIESPIAKITFNRKQNGWKLFAQNRSGEWEGMFSDLIPTFSDAIKVVEDDDIGIFFG